MSVQTILNTIRANSSALYQERIPEATKENLTAVGNAILAYEATTNEFLGALVNRIAFTEVSNRRYSNPLAPLKKGHKVFGTDIEDIYTNPTSAVKYEGTEIGDMLAITKPDVKTIFHRLNRQDKYPVSITDDQLKQAFTSEGEMSAFIQSVITAMYSGDEMDEYMLMISILTDAIKENKLVTMEIDYTGDEATSKDLVKLMNTLSKNFAFKSTEYNGYNKLNATGITGKTITPCITHCPQKNQVILMRTDVSVNTNVEVLAQAFNMSKAELQPRVFEVDAFGDTDVLAIICDEALFKFYDAMYKVTTFYNPSNLVTNYWLHHWQTLSLSLFANCVAIKQKA